MLLRREPSLVTHEHNPCRSRTQMTYVQALTGRGGWPMSVWLTPQLQPIMGATYLPPIVRPAYVNCFHVVSVACTICCAVAAAADQGAT